MKRPLRIFRKLVLAAVVIFTGILISCPSAGGALSKKPVPSYLAFQIFTVPFDSKEMWQNFPPSKDFRATVIDLRDRIGVVGAGARRLGFVLGPIAFDHTDHDARAIIARGFDVALETGVAVGFHLDDSMFWGRLKELNAPDSIEWLDWNRTLNTGRRLDWSSTPTKILPQLCLNSTAVREAVSRRAALIGDEVAGGVRKLRAAGKGDLFLGVIAGSETQIGLDFDTGKDLGYCALTHAGFGAGKPPADMDAARSQVTKEFAGFWAQSLVKAGVPEGKVYSHVAYRSETLYKLARRMNPVAAPRSYLQTIHFTPPETAFCDGCVPGFSTYPEAGHLEQLQAERKKHGNPPWASCEGTAINPAEAERTGKGMDMEGYLGNLFNHGAVLVNIFGWGVGDQDNPFRKTAERDTALGAYRKFLRGATLSESPIPVPPLPPADLLDKIHEIQALLPVWVEKNGPARVKDQIERLGKALKEQRFDEAEKIADAILSTIRK